MTSGNQKVTLALDFGNTRKKAAIFYGDSIEEIIHLDSGSSNEIQTILDNHKPENSILSSVIHHDSLIEELLNERTNFHLLTPKSILNFTSPVGKPDTIGADRLALMTAAAFFYKNSNTLVIALGSCITYNFLNYKNEFLGGSISPGMDMRFKSMHEHTALLPLVTADWNIPLIGYNTATNLQTGVLLGIAGEINYMVEKYEEGYGNFNAVLTGGNSAFFAGRIKNGIFADHNFLFKGLYALSELNNVRPS